MRDTITVLGVSGGVSAANPIGTRLEAARQPSVAVAWLLIGKIGTEGDQLQTMAVPQAALRSGLGLSRETFND